MRRGINPSYVADSVQRADVVVLANQHGARLGADPLLPRDMASGEGERTATLSDGARVTGTSVVAAGFAAFEKCVVQYATNKDDPEPPPQVVLHPLVLGGASKFKRSGLSVLMRFIHLARALGVWLILKTPVRNETYYSVHWGFRPMTGPTFRDAKNNYVVLGVSPQWEYVSHEQKADVWGDALGIVSPWGGALPSRRAPPAARPRPSPAGSRPQAWCPPPRPA